MEPSVEATRGEPEVVEGQHPSLAQDLPNEMLSNIFVHNIPTAYSSSEGVDTVLDWQSFFSATFPMQLTRVSRSWRNAALNERSLWSTWFMEIHNPSLEALSMFKRFLQHFVTYSGDDILISFVRLAGTFDFTQACHSIAPLLACQERWGDMEFRFGLIGKITKDVPKLTLDLARLSSLQKLMVLGSSWDCKLEKCVGNILSDNQIPPSLLSLRTARLAYLKATTYLAILQYAPNLTELVINIYDNLTVLRTKVFLPCLRKLDVQKDSRLFHTTRISLLGLLELRVLEEFSFSGMTFSDPLELSEFIQKNNLRTTLLSLRLQFESTRDTTGVRIILGELCSLRSLEIHRGRTYYLLAMLSGLGDDTICPLLEELSLEGVKGYYFQYRGLVETLCNTPTRRVRAITFRDCQVIGMPGMPLGVGRLLNLPEANAYVQAGLILNICNTQGAIVN